MPRRTGLEARTTTYTIIKRLAERDVLKNENGTVTALFSRDRAEASEIEQQQFRAPSEQGFCLGGFPGGPVFLLMLIGFIQTDCKSVIPRSGATWESPGTASVIATVYQEIAASERARNDKFVGCLL